MEARVAEFDSSPFPDVHGDLLSSRCYRNREEAESARARGVRRCVAANCLLLCDDSGTSVAVARVEWRLNANLLVDWSLWSFVWRLRRFIRLDAQVLSRIPKKAKLIIRAHFKICMWDL